ncbi:MAG: enhanced serine sensitivity protein SseB [Gammaproteobacteria bacterium]|nr:enhanced serine sensitivity protein SseB [Gammaproteobacteria bacterium]
MNIIDEPENKLETLLRLATTEPAHRPEFCKVLLDSTVLVLGNIEAADTNEKKSDEDDTIAIVSWEESGGESIIPFFSSMSCLESSVEDDASYLEVSVREFFKMTLGTKLVMNPHSEYGKEFFPDEIELLLTTGMVQESTQRMIETDNEVVLGEPEEYPGLLVDSLTTLFSKHANVKAAYLALIHDKSQDDEPNYIIGIQGNDDLEKVIEEAGQVARDVTDEEEIIDFIIVEDDDDDISSYFIHETRPFYEGRWGSKIEPYGEPGKA